MDQIFTHPQAVASGAPNMSATMASDHPRYVKGNPRTNHQPGVDQPAAQIISKSSENHVRVILERLEHAFLTGHRKTGFKSRVELWYWPTKI